MNDVKIDIQEKWVTIDMKRCRILLHPDSLENGVKGKPISLIQIIPAFGAKVSASTGPGGALIEVRPKP